MIIKIILINIFNDNRPVDTLFEWSYTLFLPVKKIVLFAQIGHIQIGLIQISHKRGSV